ncbi:MAG: D-Ala-D-Ala carboxypeptidase family metallohydrolase [Cetobacterium sp.]|uniref:D-Ala-D-Ala carboxypeptidase family metallohydrolase n=1 Tax=Cetobacterium sp. TaxID=2071632 RepID=UPI003F410980
MSKKISNYFSEKESIKSSTGDRLGIKNIIPDNLKKTVAYTAARMDTVRLLLNVPCTVNSFYRNQELNNAVGGSRTSDHMQGKAVDFVPVGMNLREAYNKIKNSGLSYDQLIIYPNQRFIHISFQADITTERKMAFEK